MQEVILQFLNNNSQDLEIEVIVADLYDARDRELTNYFSESWIKDSTEDELRDSWNIIKENIQKDIY